jgi:hypothetical protein
MSAAAIPRPKHGIVKVPMSYFTRMLSDFEIACDRACFGLVLQLTIGLAARGRMKARTWAPIKREQFAETARVDPDWAGKRVSSIVSAGIILERYEKGSGFEYAIAPELSTETRGETISGRCSECKVIGKFPTRFIPMPLEYFTVLTLGLSNAALLVTAVVARWSHEGAWSAEHGLVPTWQELYISDFEKLTPLEARQISTGIEEAEEAGVIEVQRSNGKPTMYRTLPENWGSIGKKKLRLVVQPPKKTERKPKNPTPPKPPEDSAKPENKLQSSPAPIGHGWCAVCCHITVIEPVSAEELAKNEAEQAPAEVIRPPRPGPKRETKPMVDRTDIGWEVLKGWHDPNRKKTVLKA